MIDCSLQTTQRLHSLLLPSRCPHFLPKLTHVPHLPLAQVELALDRMGAGGRLVLVEGTSGMGLHVVLNCNTFRIYFNLRRKYTTHVVGYDSMDAHVQESG
jgi:hypothetical protein